MHPLTRTFLSTVSIAALVLGATAASALTVDNPSGNVIYMSGPTGDGVAGDSNGLTLKNEAGGIIVGGNTGVLGTKIPIRSPTWAPSRPAVTAAVPLRSVVSMA